MATETVCPPLGTGSVDFNALHDAAKKGQDLEAALEKATTRALPAEPEPEAAPPAPAAPDAPEAPAKA